MSLPGEPWDWSTVLATNADRPEDAHRRWYDAGLADGLPILPPTSDRVRRLYRAAGLDPAAHIAVLEPSQRSVSVYDLAVCAVAAGCDPAGLIVLAAAVRAVCLPEFNLLGLETTTGTASEAVIVHGPLATHAAVSGGADCLAGSTRGNATIGRALRLVLRALGSGGAAGMDRATMGQPAKLGLCFAENTAASPWPPLHISRGLAPETSAVTVAGISGSVEIVYAADADPDGILDTIAGSMTSLGSLGSRGLIGGGSPLLILCPEHARALSDSGLDRPAVQRAVWERAVIRPDALPPAHRARITRHLGEQPAAPLRIALAPEDILIAVAGGVGAKSSYLPSWGGGTRAVTLSC